MWLCLVNENWRWKLSVRCLSRVHDNIIAIYCLRHNDDNVIICYWSSYRAMTMCSWLALTEMASSYLRMLWAYSWTFNFRDSFSSTACRSSSWTAWFSWGGRGGMKEMGRCGRKQVGRRERRRWGRKDGEEESRREEEEGNEVEHVL